MSSTSTTLEPAAMISASFNTSAPFAQDLQDRDSLTEGDDFDAELMPGTFRRFGLGFRRLLARLKAGLGRAFSRRRDGESGNLRAAMAEGRRQVAAERKAARQAAREARALLGGKEPEVGAAGRPCWESQEAYDTCERVALLPDRSSAAGAGALQLGDLSDGGKRTIQGMGPWDMPQARAPHRTQ